MFVKYLKSAYYLVKYFFFNIENLINSYKKNQETDEAISWFLIEFIKNIILFSRSFISILLQQLSIKIVFGFFQFNDFY